MQLFSEGKDTNWGHIYYKTECETVRDKTKIGIRWKITWSIDRYYYFGFNIVADVYTEGVNRGRQVKANQPNKGSGVEYFPNENEYYWFDKGYNDNNINGCRIIMKSTNGSSSVYDTGDDRIVTAPSGVAPIVYTFSTLMNNLEFDIGDNIPILISDTTNQSYNYKLYLDIWAENNAWQNVKMIETTSKNFTLDIQDITTLLYSLLPTRNSAKCRLLLETYINGNYYGTNIKEGICFVTNSNPEVPNFGVFGRYGGTSINDELSGIIAGYGPYNTDSNAFLAVEDSSLLAKNGATLKKLIIEWNGITQEVNL
jgi:hypothetical protein